MIMAQTGVRKEIITKGEEDVLKRGFLFACTDESERACLERRLFATWRLYGPVAIRIRSGDILFLNNIDTDTLYGVFKAITDGNLDIEEGAFNGRYRYQVKVEPLGGVVRIEKAKRVLSRFGLGRNRPVFKQELLGLLETFKSKAEKGNLLNFPELKEAGDAIASEMEKIENSRAEVDIEEEIPLIEPTTFWDFPRQSYGLTPKGDNKYAGVTPALIIYNMLWRYTDPGDLVVDPMCGSGTTIDVCKEEKRRVIGYDIHSIRPDIIKNDARHIPLQDNSVDMVFIDSPFGDNIRYKYCHGVG
jgi:hypothetical protein